MDELPIPPASPWLALALRAAHAAAALIREAAADPATLEVRLKRPNDFVTRIDVASESLIVQTLLGAEPGHAVMGEEQAALHGNPQASHVWIVDPVDGTVNLIHGIPAYAVSIALAVRGRLEVGVVLDVQREEVFAAARGQGAWLGRGGPWQRMAVSACAEVGSAVVATSAPRTADPDDPVAWARFAGLMRQASAVRRGGSAALDLAWVAAGRHDAAYDLGLAPWDVAAGTLLVREAGGLVTTLDGDEDVLSIRETLAAGPGLHAALCRILSPAVGASAQAAPVVPPGEASDA
jgi:myo-inositol-1(or 4)-monophosphatase